MTCRTFKQNMITTGKFVEYVARQYAPAVAAMVDAATRDGYIFSSEALTVLKTLEIG